MLKYLNDFLTAHEIRPKLLIVDDQAVNIQVIREVFKADYDVYFAMNGAQALEQVRQLLPDLILLDVMMPDMDGYEVCSILKEDPLTANIPVIFITGKQSPEDELEGFQRGGSDFISKPIHPLLVEARVAAHVAAKLQADLLKSLANMDGLTGIANRRHFNDMLETAWKSGLRQHQALSLILVDIDGFRKYNDSYGHDKGDDCLKRLANIMKAQCNRPMDLAARYSGEEFALVLPGAMAERACILGESILRAIEEAAIPNAYSDTKLMTASVGVATVVPAEEDRQGILVQSADLQLYLAKQMGKGQLCSIDLDEA